MEPYKWLISAVICVCIFVSVFVYLWGRGKEKPPGIELTDLGCQKKEINLSRLMRSRHLLQNGQKSCHLSVPVTINEQIPDCGESSCGRWQHAMERQMAILCRGGDGNHLPKIHACVQFLHTCASTLVHTHTGVRKVQMTMALFGAGRWRPLMDSLRATHSGTPCPLGRNPDERIWEIRKYAGKSELCPLSMNPLVVVRCGKSSEWRGVDSGLLCLFVWLWIKREPLLPPLPNVLQLIDLQTERWTKRPKYPSSRVTGVEV